MLKNVEQCICLSNFEVLFLFLCIWFYVFAPGSHFFAIDILNRSAICTVHFRSIWTAPLRFSTCRSWAGSKVTAAKLVPKKSKFHLPNWMFKCVFHIFQVFFPSAFSKRIFKTYFSTFFTFSHIFSHVCEKKGNMHFENALGKKWKNAFRTCEKMWV